GSCAWLANFSLLANISYIESEVNIGESVDIQLGPGQIVKAFQTNATRALQGQAPYVVNTTLQYDWPERGTIQLLYNTLGSTLAFAGTNHLPDICEEPRNQLDLTLLGQVSPYGVPLNAKLSFENLLDDQFEFTQGGNITHKYTTGVTIRFSLTYKY